MHALAKINKFLENILLRYEPLYSDIKKKGKESAFVKSTKNYVPPYPIRSPLLWWFLSENFVTPLDEKRVQEVNFPTIFFFFCGDVLRDSVNRCSFSSNKRPHRFFNNFC